MRNGNRDNWASHFQTLRRVRGPDGRTSPLPPRLAADWGQKFNNPHPKPSQKAPLSTLFARNPRSKMLAHALNPHLSPHPKTSAIPPMGKFMNKSLFVHKSKVARTSNMGGCTKGAGPQKHPQRCVFTILRYTKHPPGQNANPFAGGSPTGFRGTYAI
jgi:hypothetical protein